MPRKYPKSKTSNTKQPAYFDDEFENFDSEDDGQNERGQINDNSYIPYRINNQMSSNDLSKLKHDDAARTPISSSINNRLPKLLNNGSNESI